MAVNYDNELGFSQNEIDCSRKAFFHDCPNGRCSKRKFLTFIRKSCLQKSNQSNIHIIKNLQNYRHSKKFFSMMFDIYDQNHDGELDFNEFIYALSSINGANRLRTIETLFKFFDIYNQGYITQKEFNSRKKLAAQFLGQYKPGIKDSLLYEKAFNTMDINQDGRISKEEFIQWYLKDHSTLHDEKSMKKRTRLLKISTTGFNSKGQIKTSSLQQQDKYPIDLWLETTMNINNKHELSSTNNTDRYLLKIFYRARNHFHHEKFQVNDNQSDSGVITNSSSITNFTDYDIDSSSFFDINNEDDLQLHLTNDKDEEILCQSLETVLMETLIELRQKRINNNFRTLSIEENEQIESSRL
ncbi:unnamed protein product [Rotaria sp. Silwood1]|nr:unnamed protein product [Rotaria sp. Silwood1]CAF3414633.1 unnamed protein product [Rotaria sp. Silwood1]CAF4616744.1 unnamed protein product [Rotaria sp. Silwood1]